MLGRIGSREVFEIVISVLEAKPFFETCVLNIAMNKSFVAAMSIAFCLRTSKDSSVGEFDES